MRFTRALAAAMLAGVLLLVPGCSAGSQQPVAPTTSMPPAPIPAPTSTPTPTHAASSGVTAVGDPEADEVTVPPARPGGLDGPPSEETAAEAASYFMLLSPYIFATGDLTEWKSMSGESCKYCASAVTQVQDEQSAGKVRLGSRLEIASVQVVPTFERDHQYIAGLTLAEHEGKLLRADGTVEEDIDYVLNIRVELLATWTGDRWRIDGVDIKWSHRV